MIIKRLQITKLYDIYNYDIIFNDDLSFLYGVNGSGKTTILNILTYIIKGKFYDLKQYKFKKCTVFFDDLTGKKSITISNDKFNVKSNYFNLNFKITQFRKNKFYTLEPIYQKNLKAYINSFNYLFLPLSREAFVNTLRSDLLRSDLFLFHDHHFIQKPATISNYKTNFLNENLPDYQTYLDSSLENVKDLIKKHCFMIATKENGYNEIFRKKLIETLLSIDMPYSIEEALAFKYKKDIKQIIEDKKSSITETIKKFLKLDNSTSNLLISKISKKFDILYDSIKNLKNAKDIEVETLSQYLWHYGEIKKLESLYNLGQELSQEMNTFYQRKELFLKIINSFFDLSQNYKKINIHPNGDIELSLNYQEKRKSLDIKHLSSGEKHLLIIFANLIFNMKQDTTGIYIVDEPEASLHLKWQANFVKSLKEATNNIQLIFATHSPEIINKYRDKMIKIQADINGSDFDE